MNFCLRTIAVAVRHESSEEECVCQYASCAEPVSAICWRLAEQHYRSLTNLVVSHNSCVLQLLLITLSKITAKLLVTLQLNERCEVALRIWQDVVARLHCEDFATVNSECQRICYVEVGSIQNATNFHSLGG